MRLFLLGMLTSAGLFGAPKNPSVVEGSAKIEGLRIEAADRTIIHWSDFSIEADERVEFVQPSSDAAVLNRVVDAIPSRLMGRLEANGRVVLINPNGILVGKGGVINTGAFLASSLDMLDRAFVEKGELIGREISRGLVVNEGEIQGREVCLVGFEVQNVGLIEADRIGLVGAQEVEIKMGPLAIRTKNCAEGLRGMLEEQNPFRFAFTHPEDLDFPEIVQLSGVTTTNMSGPTVIEQGSVRGDEVYCLGDYVDVKKNSVIKGRSVWIGGDRSNEGWKGSSVVRIDGTVNADGMKGGNVIAWSEGAMGFYGSISARGVEDGGFAEVSGRTYLDFKGRADLRAESGVIGTLLMDPPDISINTNPDSPGVVVGPTYTIPALGSVDVNNTILGGQLDLSNVLISSNTAGGGTGNITVDAPVNWTMMASTLTLDTIGTVGSITVNDVISSATGGGVILNSAVDISVLGPLGQIDLDPSSGSISLTAGRNILIESADPSLRTGSGKITAIASGNITIGAPIVTTVLDAAPATAQIFVQATGNVQMGTPTMTADARLRTEEGDIFVQGFDVVIGEPTSLRESTIEAGVGFVSGNVTVNAFNDFNMLGGIRASNLNWRGDMIVSVRRNANLIGGFMDAAYALMQGGGGVSVLAVGNDLLIRGGSANDTDAGIDGIAAGLPNEISFLVGRDLRFEAQAGSPTNTESPIAAIDNTMIRVGRNIFVQGGFDPSNFTLIFSVNPGTVTSIFSGGDMVFQNEVTQPLFQFPGFNNDSTDIRAGGNIQIGADIDKTGAGGYIYIESDATIADLWTATPNAVAPTNGDLTVLAGTPLASPFAVTSNGTGAVIVDTGTFGAATWITATGDVSILSRDLSSSATPADFVNGVLADQVTVLTTNGNVEINGFRNILSDSPISTTADVLIRSMNNLTIAQPISAGNIVLVCDEQGPNGIVGGIWNLNGGAFTTLATGAITSTGTLQIFTARQGSNSIAGLLNGQVFVPGTLFIDTDTEHWCVYFGGPGSAFAGPLYTVFYKECLQQITTQASVVVSQFLVDLHPYNEFPGWSAEFFIEYREKVLDSINQWIEPYYLTRRNLKALNQPKSYTALLREDRI